MKNPFKAKAKSDTKSECSLNSIQSGYFELRIWSANNRTPDQLEELGRWIQKENEAWNLGYEVVESPAPTFDITASTRKENEQITGLKRLRGLPRYRRNR